MGTPGGCAEKCQLCSSSWASSFNLPRLSFLKCHRETIRCTSQSPTKIAQVRRGETPRQCQGCRHPHLR